MKTVLVSVTDKTGLDNFLTRLERFDTLRLIGTTSTVKYLEEKGFKCIKVEELTGFPEILSGRVKTLHPKVFAGILARPITEDRSCLAEMEISEIDLVVVNLYAFEDALKKNLAEQPMVEQIDVGGVALLRAAAKNFERVAVINEPSQYDSVIEAMDANKGEIPLAFRRKLAYQAFARTASYDQSISTYLGKLVQSEAQASEKSTEKGAAKVASAASSTEAAVPDFADKLTINLKRQETLRYGENPHQAAAWYQLESPISVPGLTSELQAFPPFEQLQGKEMSSNNITDTYALVKILRELVAPAVVVIKHNNPCGVAQAKTLAEAYEQAYECDPMSAFGGVYGFTGKVDAALAERITRNFVEIVLAPEYDDAALEVFKKKKNVRVLKSTVDSKLAKQKDYKLKHLSDYGFLLEVDQDAPVEASTFTCVTEKKPDPALQKDIAFTWSVVKHLTSNAIFVAKDGLSLGFGIGQTSRIASTGIALRQAGEKSKGAVMASEAFLPATDNIEAAAEAGIAVIIQPGGSIKDADVIAACNKAGIAMVFTGQRCFKH
ncbi:bifunctional phosphoribosylaminoimidazolecarboxamide formyltransferase/IMP cyclohydrolase [soil metagenome]